MSRKQSSLPTSQTRPGSALRSVRTSTTIRNVAWLVTAYLARQKNNRTKVKETCHLAARKTRCVASTTRQSLPPQDFLSSSKSVSEDKLEPHLLDYFWRHPIRSANNCLGFIRHRADLVRRKDESTRGWKTEYSQLNYWTQPIKDSQNRRPCTPIGRPVAPRLNINTNITPPSTKSAPVRPTFSATPR